MMSMLLIVGLACAWLGCAIYSYGVVVASLETTFPRQAQAGRYSNRIFSAIMALWGPFSLFWAAFACCLGGRYAGWRL